MLEIQPVLDTERLERMYNNRARVPDFADYFQRWAEQSASARKLLPCVLDVAYGKRKGETLDVFAARMQKQSSPGGAPVIVFIHGGYWRSLDKSDHSFVAPVLTAAGACVVVPNYDLCPSVTIPHIALEMVNALAWTAKNIAQFGGDPQRITVVGHSAGGHLGALLLACEWKKWAADLPVDLVKNVLSISGLYELGSIMQTPSLQASMHLTAEQVMRASPAWMPSPPRGQLYSVVGADESEEFLRHNVLIQHAWGKSVVPVCEALAGRNHFNVLEALIETDHRLHQLLLELLRLN